MYSANLVEEASRYIMQLDLQLVGSRAVRKGMGVAYIDGRQPPIESRGGRTVFARTPPGWAGVGTENGLVFK